MKLLGMSAAVVALTLTGCGSEISTTDTGALLTAEEQRILDWSSAREEVATQTPPERKDAAPVGTLLAGLEQRLKDNPDDAGGWTLLAQSYAFTGQMADAKVAAERAVELGADADQIQDLLVAAHTRKNGR